MSIEVRLAGDVSLLFLLLNVIMCRSLLQFRLKRSLVLVCGHFAAFLEAMSRPDPAKSDFEAWHFSWTCRC